MAKETALDEFLRRWEDFETAKAFCQVHEQDSSNPAAYEKALEVTARTDPGYPALSIRPDPRLGGGVIDPQGVRRILYDWRNVSGRGSRDYANENLERILNATDEDKLKGSLTFLMPYKIGDKKHDSVARLHEKYMQLREPVNLYLAEKKTEAFNQIYSKDGIEKVLREILEEKDKKDSLGEKEAKEKGAQYWYGTLMYLAHSNPAIALQVYAETSEKKYQEMLDELGSKSGIAKYIRRNIGKAKDEEKVHFYSGLYRLNKAKDEENVKNIEELRGEEELRVAA